LEIPRNIEKILDLARWAPSGDNTQPWRFEIVDDSHFIIHGSDTRDWCVYDLDGRASQIAIGALLENIAIAASDLRLRAEFVLLPDRDEKTPTISVRLIAEDSVKRDGLVDFIRHRVTQRRAMKTTPLSLTQKRRLEESLGSDFAVDWVEGPSARWKMARLLSANARIRLTIPEAYEVHRRIIAWGSRFSEDKIPDQAVGLDPIGLRLMHWAMKSWSRVEFLNRYLAGTWLPRLQLDLAPGYLCGAHFLICAKRKPENVEDYINGGRAMQRFWLTATQQGLQLQPEMTPLIFAKYIQDRRIFTGDADAANAATYLAYNLGQKFSRQNIEQGVFMGRIGHSRPPSARSTRFSVAKLIRDSNIV